VQQYRESQNVLDIKFLMGRLEGIWNKYKVIQDRLESVDWDSYNHGDFRNCLNKILLLNVKMQRIVDEHDAKSIHQTP
jgi:hypothetical protein